MNGAKKMDGDKTHAAAGGAFNPLEIGEKLAFALGAAPSAETVRLMSTGRAPENPFEWWLSLFPAAPLFGVRWIFAASMQGAMGDRDAARESNALAMADRVAPSRAEPADVVEPAPRLRVVGGTEKPSAEPEPEIEAATDAAPAGPDDLKLIKGVGPKLADLLVSLGVTRFEQIAAFDARDIEELDEKLGAFRGRAVRDDWVAQAKDLVKAR